MQRRFLQWSAYFGEVMAVANSIMQSKKECFISKATDNLHRHH